MDMFDYIMDKENKYRFEVGHDDITVYDKETGEELSYRYEATREMLEGVLKALGHDA